MRPDVYQRASALSLAIALVSVVLAALFAAPAAGTSPTVSPIIDNSPRDVLIRTGTPAERIAFGNSGIIPLVDYGGFVLATVSGDSYLSFYQKNMILRVLSDRSTLYLGSVQFDTAKGEPTIASDLQIPSYPAGTAGLYLVQFIGPIRPTWLADLKVQGVHVYNYIPNFAFIVEMTPETASRVARLPSVQWVGIYQPAYRISHLVYQELNAPDALSARVPNAPLPNYGKPQVSGHLALSAVSPGSGISDRSDGRSLPAKASVSYDLSILMLSSTPTGSARTLGSMAHRIYQTMDLGRLQLVRISADAGNLPRIASMPGVYWIEPFYQPHVFDEVSSQISAGNYDPSIAPGYLDWLASVGFSGAGVTVAVADTGVDTGVDDPDVDGDMHPELDNRVVANLWYGSLGSGEDGYGHGTHVAGIVAGDGALGTADGDGFLWGLGIAPEASILNQRIFTSGGGWSGADYYDLGADAYNFGASISSNSWGISDFGEYLVDDMIYDGLVRDADVDAAGDQPVTFEFSAGNSGWGGGTPVYGSTGSPGNAKNVITTGATLNYRPTVPPPGTWPADNIDATIGFSSRGPTADGRIKPELVAPGGWIASLLSSASFPGWCWQNIDAFHEYCGGTSMSGPMVSGGAALFVEYYRSVTGTDPSPAITKAALVNGAVDMPSVSSPSFGSFSTGPIPNMDEGWGRLHLANVIASTGAHLYDDQQHPLTTGETWSYDVAVGIVDQPFRASLAWTDLPGSPGASTELVNDLDLTVTAPDGTMYQGNNFVDGWSVPGGSPDVKNNLENVYVSTPQVGIYTVTVTGVNVANMTQDFAIVVSYGGGPTSDGQVFWGQGTFRSDALADVVLMDVDLDVDPGAPDSATMTATSDTGDSETMTATEVGTSSGVFTGSIQFTSAPSGPDDGVLTVANLGIATISYDDASPVGTKTDTAIIDDDPPVISGVAVTGLTHNSARIEWATNEPSTTVLRYDTATPPASPAIGSFGTGHAVSLTLLSPDTTYFYEVESTDEAGNMVIDDNAGSYYSFVTLPVPPVILVDNDFGSNYETYYTAAFTAIGQDYDYWNVASQGYPTISDLSGYPVVFWFTPGCGFTSAAQATAASYLDGGGRLIVSGQDIGWCDTFIFPGPLFGTYLHASWVVDDPGTRGVLGVAGDPIGDGLSFSVSGGDGANNNFYPDVVDPIAPAETAAIYDSGPGSRSAILHVDTGLYQAVLLAFNFEGISSAADRTTLMDRLFGWILPPAYGVRITPGALSMEATPGQTVTYDFTVQNRGVALPEDTFDLNWSSAPLGWATALWNADGSPVTDTNGDGFVDTGPIPSKGAVTMHATVDVPASAVDGDSDTAIVIANSVSLATASAAASLTTLVPLPGVVLSPGLYFPVSPGDTLSVPMTVQNAGGEPDTLNLAVASQNGWTVELLASDGVTPLVDTDGDGLVDVGTIGGLEFASFYVWISVPSDAAPGVLDLATVVGSPARDPGATGSTSIVLEFYGPGPSDWPTFHNTNSRRGASPNEFVPPMTQLWSSVGNLAHLFSGPIYADGKLFSTSLDQYVRARDPFTGATLWSRYLGDFSGLQYYTGTPAYADGVVYTVMYSGPFGTCLAPACGVYALDADTGETLWYTGPDDAGVNFNARVSVAYADGMVFGAGWDGQVFALDASTGDPVWVHDTGGLYPWAGATVAAGMLWIAGTDPFLTSGTMYALDEMTGDLRWSAALDGGGGSAPLFAHGNVYVGSWNGNFFTGTMFAFNAFTGEEVWSAGGFNGFWFDTPAYDGTNIYFGDLSGAFRALDASSGTPRWSTFIPGSVQSSVALANGFVYGAATDGNFYVLDASDGGIVDSHLMSFFGSASHAAVGRGYVWVEDASGALYAFGAPGAGVMTAIETVPGSASVAVGSAVLFRAQAYDLYGNPSPGGPYAWDSVDGLGTVLPLSANGDQAVYVAGIDAGTDTLHVESGAFGADASVSILPGALDHIDVLPGVASVVAGTQWTFGAEAKDRFGNTIPGAAFTWGATGGIGTIDASGVFTAGTTVGVGTVTAQSGSKTGTAIVEIVPGALASLEVSPSTITVAAGGTLVVNALGFDQFGNEVSGLSVSWASTIGSVAPVGGGSPIAILSAGYTAGSGTLSVASGGLNLQVAVTITPGPVSRIDVSPTSASVMAGGTLSFGATPKDIFGNAVSGVTVSWSASSTAGTISPQGVLTAANAVGAGTVTATAGPATVTVEVTIVPGPASRIAVNPTTLPSMAAGTSTTLVATVFDAHDNAVSGGSLAWSADGGTLLRLSSDDRLYQYTAPTTIPSSPRTITVTSGTISRTIAVTVVAGPPAAVAITAPQTSVAAGGSLSFTGTVTDGYGNAVAGAPLAWSASGGATITPAGVLTAPQQAGSIVVTASSGIPRATVSITVTAGPVDRLVVSTSQISVATGSGITVTVGAVDAYGNAVPVSSFEWTTTIGTVNVAPDGKTASFFAGDVGGSGRITVTGGGESEEINVQVTESSLPLVRQATSTTSLIFLVVAIIAIAASVFMFVRYREARRTLEEMRKGGQGGPGGMG